MSTSESWDVNRHTARCTGLVFVVLQRKTGVWLRAKEMEISTTLWALSLGKDFTTLRFLILLISHLPEDCG